MELSEEAKKAIINTRTGQGAKVTAPIDAEWESINKGLVGKRGGLTRKGSIAQQRATDALLDEMF